MATGSGYERYLEDPSAVEGSEKRQRRALALFLALVVVGGIVLFAYFATGRGWSVAATIVDDTVGNMTDYTAVVFNGTGKPDLDEMEETALIAQPPLDWRGQYRTEIEVQEGTGADEEGASDLSHGLLPLDENGEISYNNLGDRIMSVFYRAIAKLQTEDQSRVFASDVRDLYETAGADVCTISITDLDRYATPRIYDLAEKRIGVFAVSSYASRSKIASIVDALQEEGVTSTICIAPRTSMVSTFEGIDMIIVTDQVEDTDDGDKGDALVIEAPYEGEVGIILISSNNVPIYKSISEL